MVSAQDPADVCRVVDEMGAGRLDPRHRTGDQPDRDRRQQEDTRHHHQRRSPIAGPGLLVLLLARLRRLVLVAGVLGRRPSRGTRGR